MWSDDKRYVSRERLIKMLGATRVIGVFGGARIYVPEPGAESYAAMASRLGEEIARALSVEFGGMQVVFPVRLIPKRVQIIDLSRQLSSREIAQRLGTSENYVYHVLAELRT